MPKTTLLQQNSSVSFQPLSNKVYIGDPCYVIGKNNEEDDWETICDCLNENTGVKIEYQSPVSDRNLNLVIAYTAHGDGEYYARTANNANVTGSQYLPVDSGCLGIVDFESLSSAMQEKASEYGLVLTLEDNSPLTYRLETSQNSYTHHIFQHGKGLVSIETNLFEDDDEE